MRKLFIAIAVGLAVTAGAWQLTTANAEAPAKVVAVAAVELIVVEPPANFGIIATHAGFTVGTAYKLDALDIMVVKVLAPAGMSEDAATARLEKVFPDLTIDSGEFSS